MVSLLLPVIYMSFISLGLPDAMLGAAWPVIHMEYGVPVSYMSIVGVLISCCTVISSLMADRVNRRFGTGLVTAVSTALTALGLMGFGMSDSFWQLLVLAIPYGLGAGSIDAALNNYVAIHYESRHMSWLHCMWGIGTSVGPFVMGAVLTAGDPWGNGYLWIALIQGILTVVLFSSLPMWKGDVAGTEDTPAGESLTFRQILAIPGAREVMVTFFCYCGLELTAGHWASSYFVMKEGLPVEEAAGYASLFYIGITVGRAVSGFVTMKLNDTQMIRLGQGIIGIGIGLMLLPLGKYAAVAGLLCIGLGCAPIYPCIIHSTPAHFGAERSQALIGVQMASAYVGNCTLTPFFGFLAGSLGVWLLPLYLFAILGLMVVMHERLSRICPLKP